MIRFWSSGTTSPPISTPRSPRATMTASVSSRIAVERVDGLRLLDLGDDVRVEPACSISPLRSRTSAAERTNESATKSTPSSSANSRSSMSFRVRAGIGHRNAGNVHALVRGDDPADDDLAAGAARRRPPRRAAGRARRRSGRRGPAGAPRRSPPGRPAARRPRARPRPRDDDLVAVVEPHRRVELADAQLRALEVGDQRDRRGRLVLRASAPCRAYSACCSCVPCEKLRRAPSMPAWASAMTAPRSRTPGRAWRRSSCGGGPRSPLCVSVARGGIDRSFVARAVLGGDLEDDEPSRLGSRRPRTANGEAGRSRACRCPRSR